MFADYNEGVSLREDGKFIARVQHKDRLLYLGSFPNKKLAQEAYDIGAKKYRGH